MDFDFDSDESALKRSSRRPPKKRNYDSVIFNDDNDDDSSIEVYSVHSSSSEDDDDDEIATLQGSVKGSNNSQEDTELSQLTTSPMLETQPISTQKTKARKSSSKKKKTKSEPSDDKGSPIESSSTPSSSGFNLKLTKAPPRGKQRAAAAKKKQAVVKDNNIGSKVEMVEIIDDRKKPAAAQSKMMDRTNDEETTYKSKVAKVSMEPSKAASAAAGIGEAETLQIALAVDEPKSQQQENVSCEQKTKATKSDAAVPKPAPHYCAVSELTIEDFSSDAAAVTTNEKSESEKSAARETAKQDTTKKEPWSEQKKVSTTDTDTGSFEIAQQQSAKKLPIINNKTGAANVKIMTYTPAEKPPSSSKQKKTTTTSEADGKSKENAKLNTMSSVIEELAPAKKKGKKETTPKLSTVTAKTKKSTKEQAADGSKEEQQNAAATSKKRQAKQAGTEKQQPKKKKKKLNFQDQVLNHMLWAFKPFTLRTLAQELKSTDTILNHIMLSLTDKGLVIKKEFQTKNGRVKELYWANHDGKAKEVNVKPTTTTQEREAAKRKMLELRAQEASTRQELAKVLEIPTNQELTEQVAKEEASLQEARKRLEAVKARIRDGTEAVQKPAAMACSSLLMRAPPKSAAQLARERCPKRIKMRINAMRNEWKTRKEKCMDFVDQVADGMEKKPKEIIKILDLEIDEMNQAVMPPKHVIS